MKKLEKIFLLERSDGIYELRLDWEGDRHHASAFVVDNYTRNEVAYQFRSLADTILNDPNLD